ncbi:uncharacterized protein LOC128209277 [Mya arenaria]|uniref:uncharacterized protein LOC128209277 n=1 Tax=Mya arenaria TaxID=6604 RepID=UPI0022E6B8B5|nr:uncharacterized protein LOC128209277 [Mya arenaria]
MLSLNLRITFVVIVVCRMYAGADGSVTISSSEVTVPEGLSLTLTCNYTGIDKLYVIRWTNNGKDSGHKYDITIEQSEPCTIFGKPGLDKTLFTYTCFTLTILNVTRDNQNDNLTCQANLNFNSGNSVIVSVSVPIKEVIMTDPTESTVTMNEGTSETFKCKTSGGLPQATIKWFKVTDNTCSQSGLEITSSVSSPFVTDVDDLKQVESILTFTAIGSDNGLRICCTASNVEGVKRVSGTKILDVRYAPSDPPVIEGYASGGTYNMIENSIENLTCSSSGGNPLANLTWSCFNNQMSSPIEQGRTVKRVVQWTARRNENARCTCTASHAVRPNKHQTAFVNVNILYSPSTPLFKLDNTAVGSSIRIVSDTIQTVECDSSGNPYPTTSDFTWIKGTNVVGTGPVLNWPGGVMVGDDGSYTCTVETTLTPSDQSKDVKIATNSSTLEVTVLYPPKLQTFTRESALEGYSFMIQCVYSVGNPARTKSTITRLFNGTSWSGDSHTMHSINRADAGLHRCTVENTMDPTGADTQTGTDTADFEINVWYQTSISRFEFSAFSNQTIITVNESERLMLVCEVLSNPNSTIRLKENHMATVLKEATNALKVEYLIQNATCSDTSVYTCTAFNNYTDMERAPSKELQLFVRCSPRPSNHHSQLRRNFTGFLHGNVTFVSMVFAYPPPEFKWKMWNGTYYKEVNEDNYAIFSSYLLTSLTILDIKEDNFVSYAVQVSNGIQPDLQEIFHLKHQVITTTSEDGGSNQASVSGGVIGGCLCIILAVVVIVLLLKRKYDCSIKMSKKKDIQTENDFQESDNLGFNAAVTYEIMPVEKESTDYDALNAGNDRPEKSHIYMSLDESTSTRNPPCENSKSEDPVYKNTKRKNSMQKNL